MLVDVAISGDRNVKKKAEKILKYKNLTIEIQRMRNAKTNLIPVIIYLTLDMALYAPSRVTKNICNTVFPTDMACF